jgi:hypothetical protein
MGKGPRSIRVRLTAATRSGVDRSRTFDYCARCGRPTRIERFAGAIEPRDVVIHYSYGKGLSVILLIVFT